MCSASLSKYCKTCPARFTKMNFNRLLVCLYIVWEFSGIGLCIGRIQVANQCREITLTNGKATYKSKGILRFRCSKGFNLSGSKRLKCIDGWLQGPLPVCVSSKIFSTEGVMGTSTVDIHTNPSSTRRPLINTRTSESLSTSFNYITFNSKFVTHRPTKSFHHLVSEAFSEHSQTNENLPLSTLSTGLLSTMETFSSGEDETAPSSFGRESSSSANTGVYTNAQTSHDADTTFYAASAHATSASSTVAETRSSLKTSSTGPATFVKYLTTASTEIHDARSTSKSNSYELTTNEPKTPTIFSVSKINSTLITNTIITSQAVTQTEEMLKNNTAFTSVAGMMLTTTETAPDHPPEFINTQLVMVALGIILFFLVFTLGVCIYMVKRRERRAQFKPPQGFANPSLELSNKTTKESENKSETHF